jgi:hypothetical protein
MVREAITFPDIKRVNPPADLGFTAQDNQQFFQGEDGIAIAHYDQHLVGFLPSETLAANIGLG